MKKFETLEFMQEGPLGILTISREKQLNALSQQVLHDMDEFLQITEKENTLRALIITGAGTKAFVAGADITEIKELSQEQAIEFSRRGQRVFSKLEDAPFVTIAAVNGFALGGGLELALSCDILLGATTAKVGLPEVTLGLIPGYGGTQRLARAIGKNRALAAIATGEAMPADRAKELGIFWQTFTPDTLMAETKKMAQTILSRGPDAVKLAKRAIHRGLDQTLSKGMELEAIAFGSCFESGDAREGITAFLEKRPAQFQKHK